MKRMLVTIIQASVFFTSILFLGWYHATRNHDAESVQDMNPSFSHRINSNYLKTLNKADEFAQPTKTTVFVLQESMTVIQGLTTSKPVASMPIPDAVVMPLLPNPPYPQDSTMRETLSLYVQAIMDPQSSNFSRLACPAPAHLRYEYLKAKPTSRDLTPSNPKYFFALDLHQCAPILPRLLASIIETIKFLGPEYCALSLVEGRSTDGTYEILRALKENVTLLGVQYFLTRNDVNPVAEGVDRIAALAELRNQAVQPLVQVPHEFDPDTTVIFVNDISLCMEDILELLHQLIYQNADMTCAMDWIYGGGSFYDVWVSRGINGEQFFEIPQSGTWEFSSNLFWNDPTTKARFEAKRSFQVFACWNGITAFRAKTLLEAKIQFRTSLENECYLGEPTFFCKDMWYSGFRRIAVVPSVNVGYDDEESRKIKERHGTVSSWVDIEEQHDIEIPELIDWQPEPPELIKCVPNYQNPSWVRWDQGLDDRKVRIPSQG